MRPPEDFRRARVTLAIAAVTAIAWLLASYFGLGDLLAAHAGFTSARVEGADVEGSAIPVFLTPFTATLVHPGFSLLLLNLVFLLICGRSVEPILGRPSLLILYVGGAYSAAAAHWAVDPAGLIPAVGASGAVSAVLGAYAALFARNGVKIANPRLATLVHAAWLAAAWVALQLLLGFASGLSGVAVGVVGYLAGFLLGLVLAKPLLFLRWRGA